MTIAVIDQGAELYWFISNALSQDEMSLKHIQTKEAAEVFISQELPKIVILNGDDNAINPEIFIGKVRNHVFARNTLFIVVTSDTEPEFKKSLIVAGAGQIFYRGKGHNPSPRFFRNTIKWFLNLKSPDSQLFEYKPVAFTGHGEFTTYGRIGWISSNECYLEVNLDLVVGQTLNLKNQLFEELEMRDVKVTVLEKNKSGRYYQYANGYKCKIESKKPTIDSKKLTAWIASNHDITKHKPIKLVYFEQDSKKREEIKSMLKFDKRYCARGYASIENLIEDLEYQLPHLVLIDRRLIKENKSKFDPIKKFIQTHFCYCVTYDNSPENYSLEDFKKDYPFAMHVPKDVDEKLLESMVNKLEVKLMSSHAEPNQEEEDKKIFFGKHSPYSRMSLHADCQITELAISGIGIELPFLMSNYCAFEVNSLLFTHIGLHRLQFFRNFLGKKIGQKNYHQCVSFGQMLSENEIIKKAIELIQIEESEKNKKK